MKIFVPIVILLLVLVSFAVSHPLIPAALEQTDNSNERSALLDMEPSESKVKKFYKKNGYGYTGYALPLAGFYPTVAMGYPLLTGYGGYYGYGGVIPVLYGR